jgi:hypothetical protein
MLNMCTGYLLLRFRDEPGKIIILRTYPADVGDEGFGAGDAGFAKHSIKLLTRDALERKPDSFFVITRGLADDHQAGRDRAFGAADH